MATSKFICIVGKSGKNSLRTRGQQLPYSMSLQKIPRVSMDSAKELLHQSLQLGIDDLADKNDGDLSPQLKGKSHPHGHHLKRSIAVAPKTQTGKIMQRHGQNHK